MLSRTCAYALRAATCIARHADNGPILAKDIAAQTDVPLQYLQKVLGEMVRNGVLLSTRGIGGGFQLRRPAGELRLVDVTAAFDIVLDETCCPFGNPVCSDERPCRVHDRWAALTAAYKSFLESTTLLDLTQPEGPSGRKMDRGRTVRDPQDTDQSTRTGGIP